MKNIFGSYIRNKRVEMQKVDSSYSLRQLAMRVGMEPSYLSKLERGEQSSLSEEKIVALAAELGEDPDLLLALNGKISSDVQAIIRKRPQLFAKLIRELKNTPDQAVTKLVREVRDGNW
jgi:HTH-type transcriptional regulator, competence development regulator